MRSANGNKYTTVAFTPEEKLEFLMRMNGKKRFKLRQLSNGALLVYPHNSGNFLGEYSATNSRSHPYRLQFSNWNREGDILDEQWGTNDVVSADYFDNGLRFIPDTSRPLRVFKKPLIKRKKSIDNFQGVVDAVELINEYVSKNRRKICLELEDGQLSVVIGGS